jgi:hypothetical protein
MFLLHYLSANEIYVKYICPCVETAQRYVEVKRHQQSERKAKKYGKCKAVSQNENGVVVEYKTCKGI